MSLRPATSSPEQAQDALERLGLDLAAFQVALLYADAERNTYTDFDAPGASESARWSRHIRKLSEVYVPQGWSRINPKSEPTLVHPSNSHCLVVASGNEFTGVEWGTPTTKNPRGAVFRDVVADNSALVSASDIDPRLEGLRQTWVFLTRASLDGRLYSEVSLPSSMAGSYIDGWRRRILLPVVDPRDFAPYVEPVEDVAPSYDFEVARR